ncbi:MAG: hypothetical protein AAF583_01590 [Pseudomonadota bacterium]
MPAPKGNDFAKGNDGGRPTKYDPSFCEAAIAFMGEGYSLTAFAGSIGVTRATVYNWLDEHEEFFDAVKIAKAKGQGVWEQMLRMQAMMNKGNTGAIAFAMKNLYPDDWRDKQEVEHGLSDEMKAVVGALSSGKNRSDGREKPDS